MKQIAGIALLAFFSLLLFGSGVFLHGKPPPVPVTAGAAAKAAPHKHTGKTKAAARAAVKTAVPTPASDPLAFPLMVAGGVGLLLSSLAGLGLSRALSAAPPRPQSQQSESEIAARQKQKEEFEVRQADLQSQLSDAKQRKIETEALREQVSRQFQEFFRTLPVPCFCFAASGQIIRWNAACETLYGIPAAAALDSTLWETIIPISEREEAEAKISRVLAGESLHAMDRWDTLAGGVQTQLRCSMVPLYDAEGRIIGGLSAGVDITEFARQEERYEQQIAELTAALEAAQPQGVLEDDSEEAISLTRAVESAPEIAGHPAFRARLAEEADRASRYHTSLSLILLDLDGFAARNRTYGFEAGDLALQSTVSVIKSKMRTVDIIAHLGADEYAIILPETGEAGARVAAERLRTGLQAAGTGSQPPQTACFGTAQLTADLSGPDELVCCALEALTSARSTGTNTVTHYQDMTAAGMSVSTPEAAVKKAPRKRSAPTA